MADEYTQKQKEHYVEFINVSIGQLPDIPGLDVIVDLALTKAADIAVCAGMSGSWSDGGAQEKVDSVAKFCAGVIFAKTGKLVDAEYANMVEKFSLMNDPEYAEFLRLKEKFGAVDGKV